MENNNKEAFKLLDLSGSDSESDIAEFTLPPRPPPPSIKARRKVRLKKKNRNGSSTSSSSSARRPGLSDKNSSSSGQCWPRFLARSAVRRGSLFVGWLMLVSWVAALSWYTVGLKSTVQQMAQDVASQEARGQSIPQTLHDYHHNMQALQRNQTSIVSNMTSLSANLDAVDERLSALAKTTNDLNGRLQTYPELAQLPSDFRELQIQVAAFGSKMNDITSAVEDLKEWKKTVTVQEESMKKMEGDAGLDKLQASVRDLKQRFDKLIPSDGTDTSIVTKGSLETALKPVRDNISAVQSSVTETNKTLTEHVLWVTQDVKKTSGFVSGLQDGAQNISASLSTLEGQHLSDIKGLRENIANLSKQLTDMTAHFGELKAQTAQLQEVMEELQKHQQQYEKSPGTKMSSPPTAEMQNSDIPLQSKTKSTPPPSNPAITEKKAQRIQRSLKRYERVP